MNSFEYHTIDPDRYQRVATEDQNGCCVGAWLVPDHTGTEKNYDLACLGAAILGLPHGRYIAVQRVDAENCGGWEEGWSFIIDVTGTVTAVTR